MLSFRLPENLSGSLKHLFASKNNPMPQTKTKTVNEKYKPVAMELKGEAGKRVLNAAVREVMKQHAKEIKALADK